MGHRADEQGDDADKESGIPNGVGIVESEKQNDEDREDEKGAVNQQQIAPEVALVAQEFPAAFGAVVAHREPFLEDRAAPTTRTLTPPAATQGDAKGGTFCGHARNVSRPRLDEKSPAVCQLNQRRRTNRACSDTAQTCSSRRPRRRDNAGDRREPLHQIC